jgi:hypothetical protein
MNYKQWNEIIADYFFKPENAGKDILFYLTKQDLIKLAKPFFSGKSGEDVWNDFIFAIKFGEPGKSVTIPYSPITQPLKLYRNWNKIDTPPFIAYLILYIIPLTETYDDSFTATNYYGKVNLFFLRNSILNEYTETSIGTGNFQTISQLWNALEEWSVITKNCDFGIFELKKFGNPNWIYVGKPFSQCVLPPSAINKLPELFYVAGLVPNSGYPKEDFRKILLRNGVKKLGLKDGVIELVKKSDLNELGQSIIETVIREYNKWTGETHDEDTGGTVQRVVRNYTIAPLFSQFVLNENRGLISFSFRMYSSNEYPEDLRLGFYDNLYEINGWSKTLNIGFSESVELKDDFNKWVARFPEKKVRLFINAAVYQLSSQYWIEIETLSKTNPMFLLCKNDMKDVILEWGRSFNQGDFQEEDLDGIPESYSLFKILNPQCSHPKISLLTLCTEKRIELSDGLKVNFRTFVDDFIPEVEIKNSDGYEIVSLQYRNVADKIFLKRKQSNTDRWLLPNKILLNTDFNIKIEGVTLPGNEIAYNLISSDNCAFKIDSIQLPKRDAFGKQILTDAKQYCQGSNIINPMKSAQRYYCPLAYLFTPNEPDVLQELTTPLFFNHSGNMFAGFLSLKANLTTEEFYRAFEFYYTKEFQTKVNDTNFNLTKIKKSALNFYDYIGYLDYDYETKKIVANPPQLIFIPCNRGRKVLLIGGRDKAFISLLVKTAPKHQVEVQFKRQFFSNQSLLLPDVITIKAFGEIRQGSGERNLMAFARELDIQFSSDYFPQFALLEFSAGIDDYSKSMQLTDENDYGWARKIFNPDNLRYERNDNQTFDKSFTLVEYKLNEYTYYNKLWKEGQCYIVDRNWGRYLILKHFKKNVIYFDSKRNRVAIPVETPLPRLLSESIMLLSGFAPDFNEFDGRYYRVFENIPDLFTKNLFNKLGQQPINKELR